LAGALVVAAGGVLVGTTADVLVAATDVLVVVASPLVMAAGAHEVIRRASAIIHPSTVNKYLVFISPPKN
jgi:hypothetical protein